MRNWCLQCIECSRAVCNRVILRNHEGISDGRRAVQLRFLQGAAQPSPPPGAISAGRSGSNERKRNEHTGGNEQKGETREREREGGGKKQNQEIPFAEVNLSSKASVYRRGIEILRRRESGKYRNGPTSTPFRPDVTFRFRRFSSSPPRVTGPPVTFPFFFFFFFTLLHASHLISFRGCLCAGIISFFFCFFTRPSVSLTGRSSTSLLVPVNLIERRQEPENRGYLWETAGCRGKSFDESAPLLDKPRFPSAIHTDRTLNEPRAIYALVILLWKNARGC